MFTERAGFLEHSDLNIADIATSFVVGFDQARESDGSGEAGWSAAHKKHIHRHRLGVGRLGEYEPVERQRSLMDYRENFAGAIRHQCPLVWGAQPPRQTGEGREHLALLLLSGSPRCWGQSGDTLDQVAPGAVVRDLEGSRVLIFVDNRKTTRLTSSPIS